jgi:hypothetical protein
MRLVGTSPILLLCCYVAIGGEFDAIEEFSETLNSRWEAQMRDPLCDRRWWASIESTVIKGAVKDKKVTASSDASNFPKFFSVNFLVQHFCEPTF